MIQNEVIIAGIAILIICLGWCSYPRLASYSASTDSTVIVSDDSRLLRDRNQNVTVGKDKEGFKLTPPSQTNYFENVPCGMSNIGSPLGWDPSGDGKNLFERLDMYGKYLPGRLNIGQAQCISNPQNQLVCDSNMYEKWFWYETLKVGYPSRDLFAYESPNPILTIRPRYRGDDPTNIRRYY